MNLTSQSFVASVTKNIITKGLETIIHHGVKKIDSKLSNEDDTPLDMIRKLANIHHSWLKATDPSSDLISFNELERKKRRRGRIQIRSL